MTCQQIIDTESGCMLGNEGSMMMYKAFRQPNCIKQASPKHMAALVLQVVLMSATLDSDLIAKYFGNCPTLAAGGRTFLVDHLFLEDVYELTQYKLDAEGPTARRPCTDTRRNALQSVSQSKQAIVKVCKEQRSCHEICWWCPYFSIL